MHNRFIPVLLLACAVVAAAPAPAAAQQTLNFSLGVFTPRGEDARVTGDVLNANRNFLFFEIDDFRSAAIGAEWLVPLGEYFEAGAGIGFSRRTVESIYTGFTENNGAEVAQELRLRLVPVSFTVRALPLGQRNALQPYVGVGLGIVNWRYSESGDFIDFNNNLEIFRASYVASGTATGPVVLGGLRFGGETLSVGGEIRYHSADADLSSEFAGSKIDLGGWTYNFTMGVRFGR